MNRSSRCFHVTDVVLMMGILMATVTDSHGCVCYTYYWYSSYYPDYVELHSNHDVQNVRNRPITVFIRLGTRIPFTMSIMIRLLLMRSILRPLLTVLFVSLFPQRVKLHATWRSRMCG